MARGGALIVGGPHANAIWLKIYGWFFPHKSYGVPTILLSYIPSSFSHVFPVGCQGAQLASQRRELLKKIQEKKAQLQKQQDQTLFLVWPWTGFEVPAI